MRYPPDGIRGLTRTSRASDFGDTIDDYLANANQHLLTVIQIETNVAVDNVDHIASVNGVDVLFIGPSDLACNLEIPCDLSHPKLQKCLKKVSNAARQHQKQAGILIKDPLQISPLVDAGFRLIALNTDLSIIKSGMKAVVDSFKQCKTGMNQ
jgi:2-keto-3-deoxy-L-rhamnonate aldolase RhmA